MTKNTADTIITKTIIPRRKLEVPLITPGGVPGVFEEPVVQAGGLIRAVTDNQYGVVYWVNVIVVVTIGCIDDTVSILMNIYTICCDSGTYRLLMNGGLQIFDVMEPTLLLIFDLDVNSLCSRVVTVSGVVTILT